MAVDFTRHNPAFLRAFGQSLTLVRSQTGEIVAFTGVLQTGLQQEGQAPGEGSMYARCWTETGQLDPAPIAGDEIQTDLFVYKILQPLNQGDGGIEMTLRQDREIG
jgi:hypothetical protein